MKRLICKIFGHKWHSLIYEINERGVFVTECKRCGKVMSTDDNKKRINYWKMNHLPTLQNNLNMHER